MIGQHGKTDCNF